MQLSFHTFQRPGHPQNPCSTSPIRHTPTSWCPCAPSREAGLSALAPWAASEDLKVLRNLTAAYELITRAGLTHERPSYGIDSVRVGNREVAVHEEPVSVTPFGTLLRFRKDVTMAQPRVLVVAPLSGHFATLLRSLVRTMLPEHDVCITDWHNARDVSIDARPVRLRRLRRAPHRIG